MGNNLANAVPSSETYCHKDQPKQTATYQYQIHCHTLEEVSSSKYLEVTISEDLTWRKHTDDTVNRANKTHGFVLGNLSDCSAPVKSAAYTTKVIIALPSNYMPISLCSKGMEHILHSQVMKHLEAHDIFSDQQQGFWKRGSCERGLL